MDNEAKLVIAIGGDGSFAKDADNTPICGESGEATAQADKGIAVALGGKGVVYDYRDGESHLFGTSSDGFGNVSSCISVFGFAGKGEQSGGMASTSTSNFPAPPDNLENAKKFIEEQRHFKQPGPPPESRAFIEANEAAAIAGLKMLVSQEAIWRQTDVDGNGLKDYWTLDVSCFHRMYRADGKTKVNFIDMFFARADGAPYSRNDTRPFGINAPKDIEDWFGAQYNPLPKSGYYFRAIINDETGKPYNKNFVGANLIVATNTTHFAFVAYPAQYGVTGRNVFIVNEGGTIYQVDPGTDDEAKIVLQWPGDNPASEKGPGGKLWQPAE
ncbi:MAG: DUF2950 family protein [Planctomycetota bacterium]